MPFISVLFWNVENLGAVTAHREIPGPRMMFLAAVARSFDADVICIQELKQQGVAHLQELQLALNARERAWGRPAHWFYDYIKGGLRARGVPPPPTQPFNTSPELVWDGGHHEGYAIFWRLNIAKFTVTRAPDIQPPGGVAVANTQSEGTRSLGAFFMRPIGGWPLAGDIRVPLGPNSYVISAGTQIGGGLALANDTVYPGGTVLPANTRVGDGGIWLSTPTYGINPLVIPGGYRFGADTYTLPAAGTVLVPDHVASLVLFGRDTFDVAFHRPTRGVYDISPVAADFAVAGTQWNWLEFVRSNKGAAERVLARRPAYVTLDVNRAGAGAAGRLVPVIVYHAPATGQAAISGMQRSAYSQPMYQAYDWAAGAWINCDNAIMGGDFNVENYGGYAYTTFTDPFAAAGGGGFGGGANATQLVRHPAGAAYDPTNVLNKSIVALNQGFTGRGPPIFGTNFDNYRKRAIDNIFYRGLPNVGQLGDGVINLLDRVTGAGGGLPAGAGVIQNFLNLPVVQRYQLGLGPIPRLNSSISFWADLLGDQFHTLFFFGNDSGQRRAAEFLRLFISDHQPVGITFVM
jgi:endonuclease/exonuclease/phosphatase family protein